ncbi:hypothetical protein [Clostridium frigidicarnis]|uniref:Uncharacterized protein n=1 Tax=Clostridium frigidicarnis TaxID=84698 RepID=A0A1I1B3Y6_9CLOT|nr:hypothetical protein [Clostridium frigidicarnis]SFB43263.1 hypothetical protein SAMN04488528_105418 [Clostridium frigidicarnis]
MKYIEAKIIDESGTRIMNIEHMNEKQAEKLEGKMFCPGEDCKAPLYLAHNPKDGGKTIFFKATNEKHIEDCQYRNENYKGSIGTKTSINGVYTEGQINDYVRNLYKDLNTPQGEKKKKTSNGTKKRKDTTGTDEEKYVIRGGRIVSGKDSEIEGNKGRMSRRYSESDSDIGAQIGVYGDIKEFYLDNYGQAHIRFKEDRNANIEVLIGQVYKNLNPQEFGWLDRVKIYFDNLIADKKTVSLVAGGLVVKYNEQLTIELQAKYSYRINGHIILDIVRGKI